MSNLVLGFSLAFFSALMYSTAAILYKLVLVKRDAWIVTFLRPIPAFLVVLIITYFVEGLNFLYNLSLYMLSLGFLSGAVGMLAGSYLYLVSLKKVGVSLGYPLSFSYPIYVSIIGALFLGEEFSIFIAFSLILMIIGVVLLSREDTVVDRDLRFGVSAGFGASILWAVSIVIVKIALFGSTPLEFANYRLITSSIVAGFILLFDMGELKSMDRRELTLASLGGIAGIGFAIIGVHYAVDMIGATVTSIVSSSSPALSIILAKIFLDERLNLLKGIGVSFVIVATFISVL